jgi:hypothetical protein
LVQLKIWMIFESARSLAGFFTSQLEVRKKEMTIYLFSAI